MNHEPTTKTTHAAARNHLWRIGREAGLSTAVELIEVIWLDREDLTPEDVVTLTPEDLTEAWHAIIAPALDELTAHLKGEG